MTNEKMTKEGPLANAQDRINRAPENWPSSADVGREWRILATAVREFVNLQVRARLAHSLSPLEIKEFDGPREGRRYIRPLRHYSPDTAKILRELLAKKHGFVLSQLKSKVHMSDEMFDNTLNSLRRDHPDWIVTDSSSRIEYFNFDALQFFTTRMS